MEENKEKKQQTKYYNIDQAFVIFDISKRDHWHLRKKYREKSLSKGGWKKIFEDERVV